MSALTVLGDAIQLQQVMLNLLSNGAEAMDQVSPELRRIRIRSTVNESGSVTMAVEDAAAGFHTGSIDRIANVPRFSVHVSSR